MAEIVDRSAVLSVTALAKELGKSELAARRMVERGQIPARRLGDRIIILRADLDQFLNSLPWDQRFERRRSEAASVCPGSTKDNVASVTLPEVLVGESEVAS